MLKKYKISIFLFLLFAIFTVLEFVSFKENLINDIFSNAKIEFENEINNKLKSTLAISITLAADPLKENYFKNKEYLDNLSKLPKLYKRYTKYKNIWLQLIDKNGISVYRSWTNKKGDFVLDCRKDLKKLFKEPDFFATVEICKYTPTLNAISPVYDKQGNFLGFIEVKSHFNSIVKNLEKFGYKTLIFADKKFKDKMKHSITNIFIQGYYVANFNPEKNLINIAKKLNLSEVFTKKDFIYKNGFYIKSIPIKGVDDEIIGWGLFFKSKKSVYEYFYKNPFFIRLVIFLVMVTFFIGLTIYYYSTNKEKELKKQTKYYFNILDSLQEIVIITDGKTLKYANKMFFEYFYRYKTLEEFLKEHKCIYDFFIDEKGFLTPEINGRKWTEELIENIDKVYKAKIVYEDNIYVFNVKASKIKDNEYVVVFSDVTRDYLYEKKLHTIAVTDPLTGLYNRTFFNEIFNSEIKRAKEENREFWLAILDIDHFKDINDTYGHQIGDNVLKEIANILKQTVRKKDLVFRIGGEEFAIIFLNVSENVVTKALNRINSNIKNTKFNNIDKIITISGGAAKLHKDDDKDSIFKRADKLLYEAKRSGRGKIIIEKE